MRIGVLPELPPQGGTLPVICDPQYVFVFGKGVRQVFFVKIGRAIDDRVDTVIVLDLAAEILRLAGRTFRILHKAVPLDVEHRQDVAPFEPGRFDEITRLLLAGRAMPEKMIGPPQDTGTFQFGAVLRMMK